MGGVFEFRQLAEHSFGGGGVKISPSIDAMHYVSDKSLYVIISLMNRNLMLKSYGPYDMGNII